MDVIIETITINDRCYPKQLKQIYDAPKKLYIRGNKEILGNFGIAIVGCRDNTKYGELIAKNLAYNLAKNGVNIISGLAKGIDSFAHIGAIYAKEKTIAVLGNAIDFVYPKENEIIAQKIIEYGGAIISEYPIGSKIERKNFPARNRIISGLSQGVIVVEAKEKSGSLITADFALEQGRDVYAVPGSITSINSVGTNKLIKDGAIPVTSYKDILLNV
ncbi:MAG: DNA-processing protein DprA [Clostridia bacterium]|nr:DNA-processing protein DprA [Clostridia bacterium]